MKHLRPFPRHLFNRKTKGIGYGPSDKVSVFWIVVLSGMAALLITIAVLQYRWAKQLSADAEARIGSSVKPLMIGWHLALYRELSAICVALQVGPDSGAHDNWSDYLHRYVDWSRAATNKDSIENIYANPEVVENIYIWDTDDNPPTRLFRLNADTVEIESSGVPDKLQSLLSRLLAKSSNIRVALRAWEFRDAAESRAGNQGQVSTDPPADKTTGWQFDPNIPAIVHPILHSDQHSHRPVDPSVMIRNRVEWIVIVLNREYLQKEILPNLTRRYFGSGEGLEYKLALIETGKASRVIYSTDSKFPGSGTNGLDSRMNVFGPPPESLESHFWQSIQNRESLRLGEWHNFSAPIWFPVIQYTSQDGPWTLILQHRSGPLEAVATNLWYRNMITGSVVLLLLTADVGLIVIASRRAQNLAKLQLLFVASISHELLTPLTAIFGAARNITDGLVEAKDDLKAHGSIIAGQTSQLIELVKENLSFAESESRTNRYTLRPLKVSEILQCVRNNVAKLIEENGFRVDQEIEEGLPSVMGDLSAVCHCLQNLIVNAIKYSGKNRWIGIRASLHETEEDHREVCITVQDRGPGISGAELRHIFKPFYRSPKVVNAQIRGTGLGLAVAERIAKELGGSLTVMSQVGVGSAFTLHLQAQREVDAWLWMSCPETEAMRK